MRWEDHVADMGDQSFWVGKPERRRPLGSSTYT